MSDHPRHLPWEEALAYIQFITEQPFTHQRLRVWAHRYPEIHAGRDWRGTLYNADAVIARLQRPQSVAEITTSL